MAVISQISSGATVAPDFTLLSTWEAWAQTEFATTPDEYIAEIYDDFPSDELIEVGGFTIDAWGVTTATERAVIRPASGAGHNGDYNAGTKIVLSGNNSPLTISQDYTLLQGLQIRKSVGSAGVSNQGVALSGGLGVVVERVILDVSDSVNSSPCILHSSGEADIRNNLIIGGSDGIYSTRYNSTIYSNTLRGHGNRGIYSLRGSTLVTNNVVVDSVGDAYVVTSNEFTNNASGDLTGQVTGVVITDGVDFVSPSTNGYSPTSTGKLAGAGADLSTDFTTDISGADRKVPWTIGAYIVSGAPPVGIQEMYIKDGGIFVKYTPHVKVGGTFQEVDAYVLEGGAWVPVHEK